MIWEYSNGGFKYIIDFFLKKEIYNRIFPVCSNKYYCLLKKYIYECLSHIGCMCLVPGYVMYYELGLYYFRVYSNKYYCLLNKKKI